MGTYATAAAATITAGRQLQPEPRVVVNGTLETTSWLNTVYAAPVGFDSGTGLDLGLLQSLSFRSVPTFENVEQINSRDDLLLEITGEETIVEVGIREYTPEILHLALGTATNRTFDDDVGGPAEAQITFGGLCSAQEMPIVIEFTNAACSLPTTPSIADGITGGILTLYKAVVQSGLNWATISAATGNVADLSIKALADTTRAKGNRIGNLYLY